MPGSSHALLADSITPQTPPDKLPCIVSNYIETTPREGCPVLYPYLAFATPAHMSCTLYVIVDAAALELSAEGALPHRTIGVVVLSSVVHITRISDGEAVSARCT